MKTKLFCSNLLLTLIIGSVTSPVLAQSFPPYPQIYGRLEVEQNYRYNPLMIDDSFGTRLYPPTLPEIPFGPLFMAVLPQSCLNPPKINKHNVCKVGNFHEMEDSLCVLMLPF